MSEGGAVVGKKMQLWSLTRAVLMRCGTTYRSGRQSDCRRAIGSCRPFVAAASLAAGLLVTLSSSSASAGTVPTAPPAVVFEPDAGPNLPTTSGDNYAVSSQAYAVHPGSVTVPLQLQQPPAQAQLAMAQLQARQLSQVMVLPTASTGLQPQRAYRGALAEMGPYTNLSVPGLHVEDDDLARPLVPLPASAWGGLAAAAALGGLHVRRRRHRYAI